jgi:hypothetical protein
MRASRLKRILGIGAVAGALYALWRLIETRQRESGVEWQPQPFPFPPRAEPTPPPGPTPAPAPISPTAESPSESLPRAKSAGESLPSAESAGESLSGGESAGESAIREKGQRWVEPADGECPLSHPVKAKLGSGIFHVPGGQMYERTRADRCYADAASAEADGLRASKR